MHTTKKKGGEDIPSKLVYVKRVHKHTGLENKKQTKKKRLTNLSRKAQEGGNHKDGIRGVE